MKKNLNSVLLGALIAMATMLASPASAQVLLSIDFNGVYYNQTQPGFDGIFVPNTSNNYQTNIGIYSLDVTYPIGINANPWATGNVPPSDTTYAPLYTDYLSVNGWDGYTLTIGGLAANTTYDITLWFYRNTQYSFNGGPTTSFSSYAAPSGENLTDNSVATTFTTNAGGSFTIGIAPSAWGDGALTGLQISAIPEPATTTMLGLSLFGTLWMSRRRKAAR